MGFVTQQRLPLGYGGVIQIEGPDGQELSIECTVRRCRETVNGWFEGSLSFNREQAAFAPHGHPARNAEHYAAVMCVFRGSR